jgi:hypothetical protein
MEGTAKPMADVVFKVMVSSTFRDLRECREAVRDAVLGQGMLPLMMETDSAIPDRGIITNSLAKVDEADAYAVLVSNYRYGQVIEDVALNPKGLSVTELEFGHAESKGLPVCVFLMDEHVPVSPAEMRKEAAWQDKLVAFRARAQHPSRIAATFTSAEDLKSKVVQTLARVRIRLAQQRASAVQRQSTTPPARPASPRPFAAYPSYTPGHAFRGRARELRILRDWATAPEPVLVFEAIGGMGKEYGDLGVGHQARCRRTPRLGRSPVVQLLRARRRYARLHGDRALLHDRRAIRGAAPASRGGTRA